MTEVKNDENHKQAEPMYVITAQARRELMNAAKGFIQLGLGLLNTMDAAPMLQLQEVKDKAGVFDGRG